MSSLSSGTTEESGGSGYQMLIIDGLIEIFDDLVDDVEHSLIEFGEEDFSSESTQSLFDKIREKVKSKEPLSVVSPDLIKYCFLIRKKCREKQMKNC